MAGKKKIRRSRFRKHSRRTPPGSVPGTIIDDPSLPPPRLRVLAYGPLGYEEHNLATLDELAKLRSRFPIIWLNVDGLGDAGIITRIGEMFDLHKLALEDVVNVHQRAKVEPYGDHLFIVIREAAFHEHLETDQISMFLGKDFVITFQEKIGDSFEPVRDRIRKSKGRICHSQTDYLAYALLDSVIDAYFPVLEAYGEQLENLEDETIENASRQTVARIHEIKREFLILRRAIWPAREAVSTLLREDLPNISNESKIYLRDCYDHLVQLIDMIEIYRETGGDLMEVYLSSVSNRLNEVMKVLTIISTIFIPLSFIAGVYGMNFNTAHRTNMPELNWPHGYIFSLAIMSATAGAMLIFFWRKGWLGRLSERMSHERQRRDDAQKKPE